MHSRLPRGVRPRLEGKPRIPLSSRVATRVSCSPLSNSRGQRGSLPQTRPDSPVPTLQGPCGRSPKRRGSLRFLPPLELRRNSIAPDPAESRGSPPTPQDPSPLRGTLGSSLRFPAEGEGNEGFPPPSNKDFAQGSWGLGTQHWCFLHKLPLSGQSTGSL